MAVYTDITEQELGAFLRDYDIGDLLSYKGIAEGTENSNFLLHTTKASYILTLYEKRVDRNDLPFFLGLMVHLATRDVTCPLPVKRNDGSLIGDLAGRPAAIITFLEGMWPRRPTAVHCRAVGEALAKLHVAGSDFELKRANALSVPGWKTLWDGCHERADEVEKGLVAEVDADFAAIASAWPKDLPAGVIHADLFPDNVFFLGDELSGLIDFYFACNDFFAYDLAICLNAWCFERDHSYNLTKGTAMLAGYQSIRPLRKDEVEALPLLCRGASLRFMLTRLYDWLHGPNGALVQKRDPLEYVRKMRFHRQIASASEYGLESK
ncbi:MULTISPECIES: homoserine kinase [unclassified Aminobacter]|uniref:homoserine kinase n=1 Tax=unclassified Aminobacter TaxID=2644704 RepID=UPI00046446B2|nr:MULTISPECIES: homoserine kinase [unclassified Aminobacter]TWH34904.1 homoserine kinase [Aminobacter sp. J15]